MYGVVHNGGLNIEIFYGFVKGEVLKFAIFLKKVGEKLRKINFFQFLRFFWAKSTSNIVDKQQ